MALRGTDPELYIIEYTKVYEDYRGSRALHEAIYSCFAHRPPTVNFAWGKLTLKRTSVVHRVGSGFGIQVRSHEERRWLFEEPIQSLI